MSKPGAEKELDLKSLSLEELLALEASLEAEKIKVRDLDPFWQFEPNDGELISERKEILRRYLKEEDIPQKVDSQLDVLLSQASIVGNSGGNRAGKTVTGTIKGIIKQTGELPLSLMPYEKHFEKYIIRAKNKFVKGRVTAVDNKQLHRVIIPSWTYWIPKKYLKKGSWEESYSKEFDILTLYRDDKPCGTVEYLTNAQEVKSSQGGELDWANFDEEPDSERYKETLLRFGTADGLDIQIDWTPTEGLCFDEETEILTERGWRRWDEITLGEKIITYNLQKDILEWDIIKTIYCNYNYKGKMYYLYNRNFDAFVTPEHRWVVKNHETEKIEIVTTKELKTYHSIKRIARFEGTPLNSEYPDSFVELCGWIIGDGCFHKGKRYIRLYQSQSRYPDKCEHIRELLNNLKCDWYEKSYPYADNKSKYRLATHFCIRGKWAEEFRRKIPDKEINPQFLTELTQKQLHLFYRGLIESDGHRLKNKNSERFGQKKQEIIDGFQMLCVMLGKQANSNVQKDKICISIKPSHIPQTDTWIQTLNKKIIDFKGLIWCVQTQNTTLIARRNGKFYLTGNSWATDLFHHGIFEESAEENTPSKDIELFKLCTVCNRHVKPETIIKIMNEYAKVSSYEEMKMRLLGEAISLSGLVYGSLFNKQLHVIEPFKINPYNYIVYRGLDPHLVTPTYCVEIAVDRMGFKYVCGCYAKAADMEIVKQDLTQRAYERNYRLGWTRCDKSADSVIKALGDRNIFLELSRGKNAIPALDTSEKFTGSIHAGVDKIKQDLRINPLTNKPSLFIFNIPENQILIKAFQTMERDTYVNEDKKGPKDKIQEGKHHAHAALRYIYQRIISWQPPVESYPQPVSEESYV